MFIISFLYLCYSSGILSITALDEISEVMLMVSNILEEYLSLTLVLSRFELHTLSLLYCLLCPTNAEIILTSHLPKLFLFIKTFCSIFIDDFLVVLFIVSINFLRDI